MKKLVLNLFLILLAFSGMAQELNCTVTVITPQIQGTQRRIFDTMESTMLEFMNNQKWTTDNFEIHERIECNLLLTITEGTPTSTTFKGKLQVQSFRPVHNSNLKSQVINLVDNDVEFNFQENAVLRFTPDYFTDNLTSVLAYYAYMMIGYDYDTFSPEGGTKYFNLAQQVVNNAQNAPQAGWKGFEGNRNRFWLVDNILHQSFKPLREVLYAYHRLGLDVMYDKMDEGRATIVNSLEGLRSVHQLKPLSYNVMSFFLAKSDELVNIYKKAPAAEKTQLYKLVQILDPGNLSKYSVLNTGG
jgi:hypothetical protein